MNNFRLVSNPDAKGENGGSYTIAYGRHRDIRYKIASVRGTSIAVYIGLTSEHPLYGANLSKMNEVLPAVEWSYASPDLFYANKIDELVWWIGWIYEGEKPAVEQVNATAKTVIQELAKGVLRGQISPSH